MRRALFLITFATTIAGCNGPPCRSPTDCPVGTHCVRNFSDANSPGECLYDCLEHGDCPSADSNVTRAICSNEGRCRTVGRPPKLIVTEPEVDQRYDPGTRTIRVAGEVTSAGPFVTVTVGVGSASGCGGSAPRTVVVDNPNPGTLTIVPFVVDGLIVDPGMATVSVSAEVLGARTSRRIPIDVTCNDCVPIAVDEPNTGSSVNGLELPRLSGQVTGNVQAALWRVHSSSGDVIDGRVEVVDGAFLVERVPLFAGANRVEVVASEAGTTESRCSVVVNSDVGAERGIRALLTWDGGTSDFDLHIIGPSGGFGDLASTLTARSRNPTFGGTVFDDPAGFGPEVLTIEAPPDGSYGFIVEPIADVMDPGASVFLRVLYDGQLVTRGPIGPAYLSSNLGLMWVAGRLTVIGDAATWDGHDQLVEATPLPDAPPEAWPPYRR